MQHHDYPLPSPETLAWTEDARRRGVPEDAIREELRGRGMDAAAIDAALAPGATVVSLVESSPLKIGLYTFGQMRGLGTFLGFFPALLMAMRNSQALRGQDRAAVMAFRFLLVSMPIAGILLAGAFLAAVTVRAPMVYGLLAALFLWNALSVALFTARVRRLQEPFRKDAERRDELAPASVMLPLGIGVLDALFTYGLPLALLVVFGSLR